MGREAPERVGRYTVHEILGTGGMATVHLGTVRGDDGTPEVVAVKRLHPNHARDAAFVTMFLDEVRVGKLVRHPNVVSIRDCVYDGEELLAVMDYVHGETLGRLLAEERRAGSRVAIPIAIAIIRDVLDALSAAHEAKDTDGNALELVHRDVTPENVLLDTEGVAHLTDFGVAKAAGRLQSTQGGGVRGKFAYAAPEQVGGDVTRTTDLYAVGLVLWELLAGKRAIDGSTDAELVMRALDPKLEAPSTIVPEIPAALDAVVLRAASTEESDRYPSAAAFNEALAAAAPSIATWAEVAAWVRLRAAEKIDARDRRIAALLALPEPASEGTTKAVTLEPPPQPKRGRPVGLVFAAITLLGGVVLVVALRSRSEPPPTTTAAPPATTAAPPPPVSEIVPSPIPSSPPAVSVTASTKPKVVLPPPPTTKPACDPPWLIDSNGVRRYNRDCLK